MKSAPGFDKGGSDLTAGDRISYATLELIAERGLSDVTMSAVAKRAGVARQTLYNHYPNIDTIVGTVVAQHQDESLAALNAAIVTMASPVDQLAHLVRHTALIAQHGHPPIRRGLAASVQRILDHHDEKMRNVVARILQAGIDTGEMRSDLDPPRDAVIILRMIEATGELVVAEPEQTTEIVASVLGAVKGAVVC